MTTLLILLMMLALSLSLSSLFSGCKSNGSSSNLSKSTESSSHEDVICVMEGGRRKEGRQDRVEKRCNDKSLKIDDDGLTVLNSI